MSIVDETGLQRQGQLEKHLPCLWEGRVYRVKEVTNNFFWNRKHVRKEMA